MIISVLMPAWQAADTVEAAARDILEQRWTAAEPAVELEVELIVVTQGDDPDTVEAVQRIDDPRLRLLHQEEPGLARALERGRAAATGEWIARMDADDRCAPTRLERQLAHAARTGAEVVPCRVEPFPRGREAFCAWQNSLVTHEEMEAERFIEVPWFHATALFRAEALQRVGGWREGLHLEDYDLVLRLFEAGVRQEKLPEALYRWRVHDAQATAAWPIQRIREQKARALRLPPDAYVAGRGRSLAEWAARLSLPAFELDAALSAPLPPGYPVLVLGSPQARARLRQRLADRPHRFIA